MHWKTYAREIALLEPFIPPDPLRGREERKEAVSRALGFLLAEPGWESTRRRYAGSLPADYQSRRALLRDLLVLRPELPLDDSWLLPVEALLQAELGDRGVTEAGTLPEFEPGLCLWRGDVTLLKAGAIVNAANSWLLGCRIPGHACIDNAIHCGAGPRLRDDCARIIAVRGGAEPTGAAKITRGYCLPASFVLHTVGPIVGGGRPGPEQEAELAACYRSCLEIAGEIPVIRSLAFCCISTGVFGYPKDLAARAALDCVRAWLKANPGRLDRVVFNVFGAEDERIYRDLAAV